MDLLDELTKARRDRGISQADLALRLSVPRLAVTRLEAGTGSSRLLLAAMRELEFRISGIARGATLPDQLRARRERLDLTLAQVAERAALDHRTVEAVERGESTVASVVAVLRTIAPKAKRSDPPRASWAFDPSGLAERDKRFTPAWFLANICEAFGEIDLDPCAHHQSPVEARRRIILPECGLTSSWAGTRLAYINPPFSAVSAWMARATAAWEREEVETMIMLAPVRTDSAVFQRRVSRQADVLFLAGRIRFESTTGLAWPAPFSLMIMVWGTSDDSIQRFIELSPAIRMRPSGGDYLASRAGD